MLWYLYFNYYLKQVAAGPAEKFIPIFLISPLCVLKECNEVFLDPPLFQAEQPQLSQPLVIGEVFHPLDHFCGPPLDPLQQVRVLVLLVLRAPELDAGLQVGSHQSRAERQNHLPQPAGHTSFDVAQDMAGYLGCEHTLWADVQLFIYQYSQSLLGRAALNPFIPHPVLTLGVALTHAQDSALDLAEPHEPCTGLLLGLVWVPLIGILSVRHVDRATLLVLVTATGAQNCLILPTLELLRDLVLISRERRKTILHSSSFPILWALIGKSNN